MWRQNSQVKLALWQNSHLSYLSHFKRQKVSLFQKRNAVRCHVKMFPLIPAISKFLKYANKQSDGVINSTKFCLNYEEKYNNLVNLYQVSVVRNHYGDGSTVWPSQFCYHGNILGYRLLRFEGSSTLYQSLAFDVYCAAFWTEASSEWSDKHEIC